MSTSRRRLEAAIRGNRFPGGRISGRGGDLESLTALVGGSITQNTLIALSPRESFNWSLDYVGARQVAVIAADYSSPLRCVLHESDDFLKILIPEVGGFAVRRGRELMIGDAHTALAIQTGQADTLEMRCDPGHRGLAIMLDGALLSEAMSQLLERPAPPDLGLGPGVDLRSGVGQVLRSIADALTAGLLREDGALLRAPAALALTTQSLVRLLVEAVPHRFSDALRGGTSGPAPRHVKRAIDFMHAHPNRAVTLAELAAVAGVSVRALAEGFRQFRGTSPLVYFRKARLAAVRDALQQAAPSVRVAEVALSFGFVHFGRFAAYYRAEFGELPSETLRK